MALIGGAGNVAGGANPSGVGTSLNYVGDHCYAYSGLIATDNVEQTFLDFTTSNAYVMSKIQWYSPEASTNNYELKVKINSEIAVASEVFQITATNPTGYSPIEILLPPYSRVEITLINTETADSRSSAIILTGRVY